MNQKHFVDFEEDQQNLTHSYMDNPYLNVWKTIEREEQEEGRCLDGREDRREGVYDKKQKKQCV